jgi:lipopolysaccharide transport system permease protein
MKTFHSLIPWDKVRNTVASVKRNTRSEDFGSFFERRRWIFLGDLLRELVARDMKVRYSNSFIGFAWALVNPLMQLVVFYFVFGVILKVNIPRYASYVFVGTLVINWFHSSLTQAASSITSNRELVTQPGFPAVSLPIVSVLTNLIYFVLAIPILIPFLLMEGSELRLTLFTLPILLAVQFVMTLGLSYLIAGVNVIFRDIEHLLVILLRLHFFLTPIFYDSQMVPVKYQTIYRLNPMVGLLDGYRTLLMKGAQPDWGTLLQVAIPAVVLLVVGYKVFLRINHRFVDEL